MFQRSRGQEWARWVHSLVRESLVDEIVVAASLLEIAAPAAGASGAGVVPLLVFALVSPLAACFSRQELVVIGGVFHRVLSVSENAQGIFLGVLGFSKLVPLGTALRPILAEVLGEARGLLSGQKQEDVQGWCGCAAFLGALAVVQVVLCRRGERVSVNLRRKLFHFAAFGYFACAPVHLLQKQSVWALGLFLSMHKLFAIASRVLKKTLTHRSVFGAFISERDRRGVLSHVLLLCGCFLPLELVYFQKGRDSFLFVLSSVCIVDGVASFFVRDKGSYKSLRGSLMGAVAAMAVLSCMGVRYPFVYYLVLGMAEYTTRLNDNITLPVVAYLLCLC
ncbi:hypothetical protein NEDG_01231 [Nematocida displodere]|uniref:Dolichol kinase n=1 Tax=Nematocida displodere TaxID=1805483 RepID=A0A177ED49_9MICR|nr:hypothetical protein NEDG_01231 [Nematocida displodere]